MAVSTGCDKAEDIPEFSLQQTASICAKGSQHQDVTGDVPCCCLISSVQLAGKVVRIWGAHPKTDAPVCLMDHSEVMR